MIKQNKEVKKQTSLKWSNRSIAFRKKHGLATTAKELQERKKNSPSGPEDFITGRRGVIKGWEDITFSVDTTGKIVYSNKRI